jgi:hypothetical protein
MNTQPVPTFPAVAGLEYLYGMNIDEMIQAMEDEVSDSSLSYLSSFIEEVHDYVPFDSQIEELHTIGKLHKLTLPFALLARDVTYDHSVDLKTRVLAHHLLFTHLT